MTETVTTVWRPIGNFEVELPCLKDLNFEPLGLSYRERQALFLFAFGCSGPKVASKMNVSQHTVDTFKRRIFAKLGVRTVAEAASLVTAFVSGVPIRRAIQVSCE